MIAEPDGRRVLILPVENQVRELDAKLLIALFAARRGYRVILGSRAYLHFKIADIPCGIYVAKSMRSMSDFMFQIIRNVGHEIVAWEEEALVHPPADTFYSLRLSPNTLRHTSHLFCWGEDNRELVAGYPLLPDNVKLHVTGNPRGDMLRPELRGYFDPAVAAIKEKLGPFLLVNTNFSDVNPFIPAVGLYKNEEKTVFGQAGRGMTREFARGLYEHKLALFKAFLSLLEKMGETETRLVVRPHPSEDLGAYRELATDHKNIFVTNLGNVLPWLLASHGLLHNGCTTAIEAYAMGIPAIAYMPTVSQLYDCDFQGFPNRISHVCRNEEQVMETVCGPGNTGALLRTCERTELVNHYITGLSGRLATERILDILDESDPVPEQGGLIRFGGRMQAKIKASLTELNMQRPGRNRQQYHDHRFPDISTPEVQERTDRLCQTLGQDLNVSVKAFSKHLFEISVD